MCKPEGNAADECCVDVIKWKAAFTHKNASLANEDTKYSSFASNTNTYQYDTPLNSHLMNAESILPVGTEGRGSQPKSQTPAQGFKHCRNGPS